ncbi:MAG: hypothetical protein QXV93_05635 [Zestosphaera sp.]
MPAPGFPAISIKAPYSKSFPKRMSRLSTPKTNLGFSEIGPHHLFFFPMLQDIYIS